MQVVELRFDNMVWPNRCCSCGGADFAWRKHSEKVLVWSLASAVGYRQVTVPVPVCETCARQSWYWYGYAAGLAAITALGGMIFSGTPYLAAVCGALLLVSLGLATAGVQSRPIKVLRYLSETRSIRLRLRNDEVAKGLLRNPGASTPEHPSRKARYLLGAGLAMVMLLLVAQGIIEWTRGMGPHAP